MKTLKNYYKILGLAPSAKQEQIKAAYRALAKQHHPDGGTGNEDFFKDLSEAYSILGNEAKRKQYDETMYLSGALQAHKKHEAYDAQWLRLQLQALNQHLQPISSDDLQEELTTEYLKHLVQQDTTTTYDERKQCEVLIRTLAARLSFPFVARLHGFLAGKKEWPLEEKAWQTLLREKRKAWQWRQWKPMLILIIAVVVTMVIFLFTRMGQE